MKVATGLVCAGLLVVATTLATTGTATANRGNDDRTIRIQDDCDPATFNAALGDPQACVGDGGTEFDELIDELIEEGTADKWRTNPRDEHIDDDEALHLVNQGGEPHTFTEVADFGAGCVEELNHLLGLTGPPAADCGQAFADLLFPGATARIGASHLDEGTHHFQCMIHPWMHTTVTVEGHDH